MTDDAPDWGQLQPDVEQLSPNTFTWNSQAPPPNTGQIRTDSRDWLGAKQLHIDYHTDGGTDVSTDLAAIKANDELRMEHNLDATRYVRFKVTAPATLTGNAYVFPVTYMTSGGTIPNSGTRILLTLLPAAGGGTTVTWTITPAREPDRYWVVCSCYHGRLAELVAVARATQPSARGIIPTTANNLRRKFGCTCDQLQPVLPPSAERAGYVMPDVQGYREVVTA